MPIVRLQSRLEKQRGIFYEYDPSSIPLGIGGMGKVYKGWCCNVQNAQRRDVAIKFLYSDLPPHVIARARREAAVQLRNDNLIEMLGFIEIEETDVVGQSVIRYHVVSEYLHGITLDDLLNGKVTDYKGDVIPFAQELYGKFTNDSYHFALIIIRSLLSGLMALHDAGYIHRDIDPSNIMITSDGHIKLIDFGIAKKVNGNNTKESSYTVAGQFIGKPKYAAPELVRGLVNSQGVCTDIYAVGILLYQLIVGKVPFDGEMAEVMEMQLNNKLPLHDLKQKAVRRVINIATQKKMKDRYQSAAEFRVAVDKLSPLPYPDTPLNYKLIGISGIAAVAAISLVISIVSKSSQPLTALPNEQIGEETSVSYYKAINLLNNRSTAEKGFSMLKDLASDNDSKSLFLLSRLYFKSQEEADIANNVDTLQELRQWLGLNNDNKIAHNLLKKAVILDKTNYKAQYELGCDFKSNMRGTTRQEDSAYYYLSKALEQAKLRNDTKFQQKIEERLSNVKLIDDKN